MSSQQSCRQFSLIYCYLFFYDVEVHWYDCYCIICPPVFVDRELGLDHLNIVLRFSRSVAGLISRIIKSEKIE